MEIISRKEAKEKGLNRYFTGKRCKRGHLSEREVPCRRCMECKREQDREYSQRYRLRLNDDWKKSLMYVQGFTRRNNRRQLRTAIERANQEY